MGIVQTIKSFFNANQGKDTDLRVHQPSLPDKTDIELIEQYGNNFTTFFYRPGLDVFLKKVVLPFWSPSGDNTFLDHDHWQKKHPFNFPGPFYTGETDSCGTGNPEAPNNVLFDSYCLEYVFKQPKNYTELINVLNAAAVEVFDSYSCNGNNYWTYGKCREWWKDKSDLLHELGKEEIKKVNGETIQLYIDYLNADAVTDLRRYCYFLEHGVYPANDIQALPII